MVTVAESYLKSLENEVMLYRNARGANNPATSTLPPASQNRPEPAQLVAASPSGTPPSRKSDSQKDIPGSDKMLDDCSSENFVRKLREMSLVRPAPDQTESVPNVHRINLFSSPPTGAKYTYSRLKIDVIEPEVTLRLPPRPYAVHLLDVFEEGFCDYHFILRNQFRQRLLLTYQDPRSQARDRIWLCRVSVVMALAEAWNSGRKEGEPSTRQQSRSPEQNAKRVSFPEGSQPTSTDLPPGAELFEQGLYLFRSPLEEANIEHIEALNLIAFYCYSLNRRRTAYLTAGQSMRTATLLRLHEPWQGTADGTGSTEIDVVEAEHRKRVWWTSYCMDRMVSNEFGFPPTQNPADLDIALPSNSVLVSAASAEFFNADILTAHIHLCRIRTAIVEVVSRKTVSATMVPATIDIFVNCMESLHRWNKELPDHMSFQFDGGIPDEPDRDRLYAHARALLDEMARVGNPAANDHIEMLRDVEDIVARVRLQHSSTDTLPDPAEHTHASVDGDTFFDGVPFFDLADFTFGGLQEEQAMYPMDWDGLLNNISFD
ncbi:zinc c6 transcription factor [Ophiostoma piceae UAMH 11346]|uniref:Zinc c6 transcription factor n=1 Tax=Ophiostoma piceae (strain UAMH 11346) TaxID=1262450 RepID=S3C0U7_OPHP1|nr:zinc c6 transcription factor [Ophiostoma piceae UAMH 11346]